MTRSRQPLPLFEAPELHAALSSAALHTDTTPTDQSPHAELQSVLPALATINPRSAPTPSFKRRAEATFFLNHFDAEHAIDVVPLWHIDHHDLQASEIAGWTYTRHLC
ncbi:hypothetical protein DL240_15760 [Lujinxingia litoralis]|uniref:Uncharacterized protein n=1 Tax=Lujinxingia litoralis TaxID=2211119 RepID=A0A328C2E2_9DELT|nr:hypothetical protein [Lujinxingia litoralis]RAL20770.1 hypothetical protein DL240_15760 [Lujinxingia litoralis]